MKVCPVCQRCFADEILSCSEENHDFLLTGRAGNREMIVNFRLDSLHESCTNSESYLATNLTLEKPCLIKIFATELFAEDSTWRELFLRETQGLCGIIHPNLVRIFERGMLADGSLYVVSEFSAEKTLRDFLQQNEVSEAVALAIAGQVAEGLQAIHTLGVWHRNIRPENLIITSDAANNLSVKIKNIDFGGIRQKNIDPRKADDFSDFKYFSPEQCNGKPIDAQTDVYSLGVVLYEMLARQVPFDAPDADGLIHKKNRETPPPITINNFNIRALLAHTLSDSLQKSKRLRLKSANIFARRLRYIEQIATHSATPPLAVSYPLMTEQKNPFLVENKIPEEILADLPTEELPPLESINQEFSGKNEPEVESNQPVLLEWEQPDDVPPMPKILETAAENQTDFAAHPVFIDYEDLPLDGEEINSQVELEQAKDYAFEPLRNYSSVWSKLPQARHIFIGAAMVAIVALAIGGRFVIRQFQIADDSRQTIAQSSPKEKSLSQTEKVTETDKSSVIPTEEKIISESKSVSENAEPPLPDYQPREVAEPPALPNYQQPEVTEKKVTVPIALSRGKKQVVSESPTEIPKKIADKSLSISREPAEPVEKVRVIIVGRKDTYIDKPLKSAETGVFNRPRIVKNPKF